mmetsp:Transcript_15293/g.22128  ORF Transcript_15293/g.22128 Transcript_15293/m.22128 type:complete len:120 (-) Transcript_15293:110-469(-)
MAIYRLTTIINSVARNSRKYRRNLPLFRSLAPLRPLMLGVDADVDVAMVDLFFLCSFVVRTSLELTPLENSKSTAWVYNISLIASKQQIFKNQIIASAQQPEDHTQWIGLRVGLIMTMV